MFTFITTKLKDEVVGMAVPKSAQTRFVGIVISTINNIPTLAFLDYHSPIDVDSNIYIQGRK